VDGGKSKEKMVVSGVPPCTILGLINCVGWQNNYTSNVMYQFIGTLTSQWAGPSILKILGTSKNMRAHGTRNSNHGFHDQTR